MFGLTAAVADAQRSSHFRVVVDSRDAKYVLDLLERNRSELLQHTSNAGIDVRLPILEIIFNATTGDFVARTGMPSWASAATRKNKIELQPLAILKQRRILETTLRHELAHVLIDALGNGQTPRWLAEGMAIYLAGEGRLFEQTKTNVRRKYRTSTRRRQICRRNENRLRCRLPSCAGTHPPRGRK
jgi:hypothetical protein